jgi:hypothetical protein
MGLFGSRNAVLVALGAAAVTIDAVVVLVKLKGTHAEPAAASKTDEDKMKSPAPARLGALFSPGASFPGGSGVRAPKATKPTAAPQGAWVRPLKP